MFENIVGLTNRKGITPIIGNEVYSIGEGRYKHGMEVRGEKPVMLATVRGVKQALNSRRKKRPTI